ncbi:MAG: hypothetical protein IT303_16700 [Dehalococcoidia bacterium]|nr:hypothetical protein [Dehalococcoidia bacterium]
MELSMLLSIGLPVVMIVSAFAVWRMPKKPRPGEPGAPGTWKDDSLDDWRRERDAAAELERADRVANPGLHDGAEREGEGKERHQRIGG